MNNGDIENIYTLSPMQQGMLFHSLYDPKSLAYFEQMGFTVHGKLKQSVFEGAWQGILARHQVLRSSFSWEELEEPLQVVHRQMVMPFHYEDWRHFPEAEQAQRVEEYLLRDRERKFDFATPPLMRVSVLQLADRVSQVVWTFHHLLLDGWSLPIILREIFSLYAALAHGKDVPIAPSRPYSDYIEWLQGQDLQKAEAFWRETLKGFTSPTPLPLNRIPSTTFEPGKSQGEEQLQCLEETTAKLQALMRKHQLTMSTLLQGAWALVLSRHVDEQDIVFGVTAAGRPTDLVGVETMLGLFINTLPLRVRVSPRSRVLPWLQEIQNQQVEARQYEYSPLVSVHGWSEVPRKQPLFESILVFENYPIGNSSSKRTSSPNQNGNLDIRNVRSFQKTNYPLNIIVGPGKGLTLLAYYEKNLFETATIQGLLKHLEVVLEAIAVDADQRLEEIKLLTVAEQVHLLEDWQGTETPYPAASCVHELFEQQVKLRPEATALVFKNERLSYGELNERANQLAHHLLALGVTTETRVGLCVERSLEMVVALLGILKAGAAYVPLDPEYPQPRLAFMLADAEVSVLLTQESLLSRLPESEQPVLCLDRDWPEIAKQSRATPAIKITPDNLAYLVYTSGSTGQPKGVAITHRAINRLVHGLPMLALDEDQVILQAAPLAFDASTFELWGALLRGGCSVLLSEQIPTAANLRAVIASQGVTTMWLTSALFNAVLDADAQALGGVRQLVVGGEALSVAHVRRAKEQLAGAKLVNGYGPTEATTFACCHEVGEVGEAAVTIPIGRPIGNTQAYVLDHRLELVPVGVSGELYLGGAGLARGYWQQAELTAERFIPHPFSSKPGERLYRTGDLVRHRNDGEIEFLGRMDQQVKIRGYRIELGEIESVLAQHPLVTECVVVACTDAESADRRLIGYVVSQQGHATSLVELRAHLRERLPEYMVPSQFVMLEELPVTPNGKVDRQALAAPDRSRAQLEGAYVAARTPEEEILVNVFQKVLRIDQVGIHDNFFELGGHSLLAMQVISNLRESFQVELPLRCLFESPTVAELAGSISRALQQQEAIAMPRITKVDREEALPLSFAQQRLWFLDQLEPDSAFYNIPAAIRLYGELNVEALQRSLSEIVRRHEALRTSFRMFDGQPLQVIAPELTVELPLIELSHLGEEEREVAAKQIVSDEAKKPFDLEEGGLLRCSLLRLAEEEHVLMLVMHHIITDGWSTGILLRELNVLYEAYRQGDASPLEDLAIQYADFAHWQRQWLTSEVLEKQLAYWKHHLGGTPPFLELPTDRPRPAIQRFNGSRYSRVLPPSLVNSLKQLDQQEGVTLFMTLLAAFQTLLYRYSGQKDFCIGTPIANRNHAEIEPLIGFFVNTLVLRAKLEGELTFRELLKRVRETCLGAYARQDVPFEKLVEELDPERSLSHTPLFQVMMTLQNRSLGEVGLAGMRLGQMKVENQTARFDLTLTLMESEVGLIAVMEYNTDLYERETIETMLRRLEHVLQEVARDADQKVGEIELLTTEEQQQLLVQWNPPPADYPSDRCVHELFAEQAERSPEAVAVVSQDERVTYRELNERANQLAHYLLSLGVGSEARVGICVERSIEMVIGLLGILKTGAAYVPMDPHYPQQRLAFLMEDAQVSVLLTQESLLTQLPESSATVVCLDRDWAQIVQHSTAQPPNPSRSDNLAYIIYTSGSTGEPKGVCITHGSINRLLFNSNYLQVRAADVVAQAANCSFDAITFELWGALLAGARLQIIAQDQLLAPDSLATQIETHQITVLFLTTALFNQMGRYQPQGFKGVRHLLFGGQQVDVQWVRAITESGYQGRLLHVYGPTEATTFATWHEVGEVEAAAVTIAIGKPIGNTQAYVLDEWQQLVPVGVVGELCIGGPGLARGYWQRAELTGERFIPHPFSAVAGERLYRTGDAVRYRADGELEFVGRKDQQVKVRGYRIELGEVESVLAQHPGVAECVVVARADAESTDNRLLAYVVSQPEQKASVGELRACLQDQLPDYMMPAAFIFLDSLPLTANGKIDRQALPASDASRPELEAAYLAPRTPEEEILVSIFAEVLKVEKVGVHDNFFELGGHSLLATQAIAQIRESFQLELPLRCLFESPTVAGLATSITSARERQETLVMPPITKVDREHPLPLSFAQQRLWFLDQLEPENPFYNIATGVRLHGELNVEALERSVSEIVRRHESLRTRFNMFDGQPVQVISPEFKVELPIIDLSNLPAGERETKARQLSSQQGHQPFDLEEGPLLRVSLLRLSDEEHVLILVLHHIVSDGWSMGVMFGELTVLYQAYREGVVSPLPELTIQYADFAHWQRQWLSGTVLEQQLAYWREQLVGAPPVLELPTDHPRPAVQSHRGSHQVKVLSAELSAALKRLTQREGVTLFMTMLAAFETLLARYSNQQDFCIGTPIANRNRAEVEPLIGFFVNTLVLRAKLAGNPSFRELLKRVREVCLEAYAHQDVPFEKLVEAMEPARALSHTPLFQVMLVVQNLPAGEARLQGVELGQVAVENQTAKFDLTLTVMEGGAGLALMMEYRTELFERSRVEGMLRHLEVLLTEIARDAEQRLTEIPLLGAAERMQLLTDWSRKETVKLPASCVHELFEAQVERTPEAVALVYQEQQLSYRELNERANQLAHFLRARGVGPDFVVGLLANRGFDLVTAVLAVFKAGGAYLPFDPLHPATRLKQVVERSKIKIAMVTSELLVHLTQALEELPEADRPEVIVIDQLPDDSNLSGQRIANLPAYNKPEDLAYVIYTSGSTGVPKGVMVEQRGMLNHLFAKIDELQMSAREVVAQNASQCFDISVWQFLAALLVGARVHIINDEVAHDPWLLLQEVEQKGITIIEVVPSLLRPLLVNGEVEGSPKHSLAALRWLVVTGEALPATLCQGWLKQHPTIPLMNAYGPTECSDDVTHYVIRESFDSEQVSVPIGRPIANLQMYILDRTLAPAPGGVSGELYVSGVGVGRGYLHDSELTAERFVPHPYSEVGGERLYRTGDLVRYRADGEIEFLGRLDEQVKIRGFRIELGEIESVLNGHPAVRESVVMARADGEDASAKRLVAYLTARGAEKLPDATELRSYLKERLPEYMVPAAFVTLDTLPLTANGKVDRLALPAPLPGTGNEQRGYVAPGTPHEEILVGIWAQVLKVERVGIHDNFFELGGDSILSIQVVSRASQQGLHLTPKQLFQHQTIAELAQVVTTKRLTDAEQGEVTGVVALTPIQHWFFSRDWPELHHFNQSMMLEVHESLDLGRVKAVVAHLLSHHDALRMRYERSEAGWQQRNASVAEQPENEITYYDLRELGPPEVRREIERVAEQAQRSLNLETGPLMRVLYFDMGGERGGRLLLIVHHLVMDGVSWRILLEDLQLATQQLERGVAIELPAKTTSYQSWARRLSEYGGGAEMVQEAQYWGAVEEQLREQVSLPVDHEGVAAAIEVDEHRELVIKVLGEEQTRALLSEVGAAYHTQIQEVLLAALVEAIWEWTGERQVVVQMEGHGREELFEQVDLTRTVGWFTSLYPLRLDLRRVHGVGEVLQAVKEQVRAVPGRGVGYGIWKYLRVTEGEAAEAGGGREAAARESEISFNYLGQFDQVMGDEAGMMKGAVESSGKGQSEGARREQKLEISSTVVGGRLQVGWSYRKPEYERATMEMLAEQYMKQLVAIVEHCRGGAGAWTPSDFPLAQLDQRDLDKVFEQLSEEVSEEVAV